MKAIDLEAVAARADKKYQLATMRAHAMRFREMVAIGGYIEPGGCLGYAWSALGHAKGYRDMARGLGQWSKGGAR